MHGAYYGGAHREKVGLDVALRLSSVLQPAA